MRADPEFIPLKNRLLEQFDKYEVKLQSGYPDSIIALRREMINKFKEMGFPHPKLESWRNTNIAGVLLPQYTFSMDPIEEVPDMEKIFQCEVPDLDTYVVSQYNGWVVSKTEKLTRFENGTILGSLAQAMKEVPEIVEQHFGKYAKSDENGLIPLNTAMAQDGFFIYVPKNVKLDKPIQFVNILDKKESMMLQPRHLVILDEGAELTLVHCDHSLKHKTSFINSVSEYFIGENAKLDHYKIQNKDNQSALFSARYFYQKDNTRLSTNTITLNGGLIRNDHHVCLDGQNCEADVMGVYLVDDSQHVDNQVFIDHAKPNSYSNELFKGILDDQAKAVFNGHIMVRKDAQKTQAFQNNRNILLTDKAKVNTKPHLEIYADDVKCSHGATIGQLDTEAMFYMRARGIAEDKARMLLMYAFAGEVVNKISIDPLRARIDDLISKRLRGELSICDTCVLDCRENVPGNFEIDLSKI